MKESPLTAASAAFKSRGSLSHSHEHFHNFKELATCLHERSLPSPTLHAVLSGPTNNIAHFGKPASPFFLNLPIDIESQSQQPTFLILNLSLNKRVPFALGSPLPMGCCWLLLYPPHSRGKSTSEFHETRKRNFPARLHFPPTGLLFPHESAPSCHSDLTARPAHNILRAGQL